MKTQIQNVAVFHMFASAFFPALHQPASHLLALLEISMFPVSSADCTDIYNIYIDMIDLENASTKYVSFATIQHFVDEDTGDNDMIN